MSVIEGTQRLKTAEAEWDFAVDGGALGTINLRGVGINGGEIPNGSVITGGYIDVTTTVTANATGTIGVGSQANSDLEADVVGAAAGTRIDIIPDSTGSTAIKTTASRQLKVTVATATATGGKFRVVVFYK